MVTDIDSGSAPGVYIPFPVPVVLDAFSEIPLVWLPSVTLATFVNVFVGVLFILKAPVPLAVGKKK